MFSMEVHSEEVDDRLKRIIVRFTTLKKKHESTRPSNARHINKTPRIIHTVHRSSSLRKKQKTHAKAIGKESTKTVRYINMRFTDARTFSKTTKHNCEQLTWNQQKRALYVQTCSSRAWITAWATTLVKHTYTHECANQLARYQQTKTNFHNKHPALTRIKQPSISGQINTICMQKKRGG